MDPTADAPPVLDYRPRSAARPPSNAAVWRAGHR